MESILLSKFNIPMKEGEGEWFRLTEIMDILTTSRSFSRQDRGNLVKLGKILTKLNARKERDKQGNKYHLKPLQ